MAENAIEQPTLRTARLTLRPFEGSDAARVQSLAGDLRVSATTASIPHPYPDGLAKQWIATHRSIWANDRYGVWAVCIDTGTLIGCVSLMTQPKHERAELGYWFGTDFWNQGFCTEAVRPVLDLGFDLLGLGRIGASHLAGNLASGRVMQKLGMQYEGIQRQFLLHRGQRHDVVHYGLLPTDVRTDE